MGQTKTIPSSILRSLKAKNPSTTKEELEEMAKDEDWYVRGIVAANSKISVGLVCELAEDPHHFVNYIAASNINAPPELIRKIYERDKINNNYQIYAGATFLCGVGKNPNTPEYILEEMARSRHAQDRLSVANNPNAPAHILKKLALDSDNLVREVAKLTYRSASARYKNMADFFAFI